MCSPTMTRLIAQSNLADSGLLRTIPQNSSWSLASALLDSKLAELPSIHDCYKHSCPTAPLVAAITEVVMNTGSQGAQRDERREGAEQTDGGPSNLEPLDDPSREPHTPLPQQSGTPPEDPPSSPSSSEGPDPHRGCCR
jgi:hypothetical protein